VGGWWEEILVYCKHLYGLGGLVGWRYVSLSLSLTFYFPRGGVRWRHFHILAYRQKSHPLIIEIYIGTIFEFEFEFDK
jgi:hypothetical protein